VIDGIPPDLIFPLLGFALVVTMVGGLLARFQAENRGARSREELTAYQVALLAGGRRRVAETALAYLTWAGVIDARESTKSLVLKAAPPKDTLLLEVERALVGSIAPSGTQPTMPLASAKEGARQIEASVTGLVIAESKRTALTLLTVLPSFVISAMGVAWGAQRVSAGLTVGFGPLIPVVAVIYGIWSLAVPPFLTSRGRRVLEKARVKYDEHLKVAQFGVTSLPVDQGMYLVALYGRDAMTGGLIPLQNVLRG
jgi:uncharacterized protein (TIGR04222 family)